MGSIFNKLEDVRADKGLTKKDFSGVLRIAPQHYNKLKDIENPSVGMLKNLKEYDKSINLDWFISNKGGMYLFDNVQKNCGVHESIKYIIQDTYKENLNNENPNSIYVCGITASALNRYEDIVVSILKTLGKDYIVVDAKDKTISEFYKSFGVNGSNTDERCIEIYKNLIHEDSYIVIKNLSKSKIANVDSTYRSLIKEIDDSWIHEKVYAKGSLIFIDYASFLEKHNEKLGYLLKSNCII